MSSAAASPARTSALQDRAAALKASAAAYGQNTPDLLARFDPLTSSWKTSQHSLDGGLTAFSETWPRSGTMRNGIAYRLPPLARPIGGTASGLWPTPDASVAQDGENPETWLARRERVKLTANNGNGMGMPLTIAARLWPTPRAEDSEQTGGHRGKPDTLTAAARLWPTPRANDAEKRGQIANDIRSGLPAAAMHWRTPNARVKGGGRVSRPGEGQGAHSSGPSDQSLGTGAALSDAQGVGGNGLWKSGAPRFRFSLRGRDGEPVTKWWEFEPDVGRVAHGVPVRVDRLRALGNAVVPQIPEIIGRAIMAGLL